jgi:hypothetical protein
MNPDYQMDQNDAQGNRISSEGYNLAEGGIGVTKHFDNSFDDGESW